MHIFLINKAINKNSCTPLKICSGERYDYLTKFLKLIHILNDNILNDNLRNDFWRGTYFYNNERMVIL